MKDLSIVRKDEIVQLHTEIVASVKKAIRIGQLLSEQKAEMAHGEFLPWIEKEMPFKKSIAELYMKCYEHRDKIPKNGNLSDAYHIAELEDHKAEQKKIKDMRERIDKGEGPPPGKEPEARSQQRVYKKIIEDEDFEQRKEELFKKREKEYQKEQEELYGHHISEFSEWGLDSLIDELEKRILSIDQINQRHEAIAKIIKKMRKLAVECEKSSMNSDF